MHLIAVRTFNFDSFKLQASSINYELILEQLRVLCRIPADSCASFIQLHFKTEIKIHWIGIMLTGLMLVIWHNCIMLECRERVWETFWALKWHRSLFVSWESCFVLSSWRLGFVFGGWKIFVEISTFLASSRELSTRESILYYAFAFN
jgi:hypothetical protein